MALPSTHTHTLRIEDRLWLAAEDHAAKRGESVTKVINLALAEGLSMNPGLTGTMAVTSSSTPALSEQLDPGQLYEVSLVKDEPFGPFTVKPQEDSEF